MNLVQPGEYEDHYWPQLASAIDTVMLKEPGSYQPISYEQMYSAVYKCVCKQYSDRLYNDVMLRIGNIIDKWSTRLQVVQGGMDASVDEELNFVHEFHSAIARYFHALASIVPIFTYMNRFYIEGKLHTDLRRELLKLFILHIPRSVFENLIGILVKAQSQPLMISPALVQSLVHNLHQLDQGFAQLAPELFSKHLVGLQAPMTEDELEAQRQADRALQDRLRNSGFNTSDPSRKRLNQDQQYLSTS